MTNPTPGRHRADTPVLTILARDSYQPAHCAGTSCLHDHRDDTRPTLGLFRSVFEYAAALGRTTRPALSRESA